MKIIIFLPLLFSSLFFVSPQALAGSRELQHFNWDPSISGGDCGICHHQVAAFLKADYEDGEAICQSCHTPTGVAHDRIISGNSHPVMVNVTAGGNFMPVYGNITAGEYNNQPFSRLKGGSLITCVTCHNTMQKTEGPARTWEYTTTDDHITYFLQNGGWPAQGYLTPLVYRDSSLWQGPAYSKTKKNYLVDPSEYTFNDYSGVIRFKDAQPASDYIYVTLNYPYLRACNNNNRLCLDCHRTQAAHRSINCLGCHGMHGTVNLSGIKGMIRTTDGSERAVVFTSLSGAGSFADGDGVYNGICEVCHTTTKYYRRDGTGFVNHSGGFDYNGKNCSGCHTHQAGFATRTGSAMPQSLILTSADNGSTFDVSVGAQIEVDLLEYGSTGFSWYTDGLDQTKLSYTGSTTTKTSDLIGAPVMRHLYFVTLAPGNTTLKLLYYQIWNGPASASDSFTVNLRIN